MNGIANKGPFKDSQRKCKYLNIWIIYAKRIMQFLIIFFFFFFFKFVVKNLESQVSVLIFRRANCRITDDALLTETAQYIFFLAKKCLYIGFR